MSLHQPASSPKRIITKREREEKERDKETAEDSRKREKENGEQDIQIKFLPFFISFNDIFGCQHNFHVIV